MKKAYSHFALLVLAAASFSSCSRADYASATTKSDLAVASPVQAPASPAADMSAQVVAPLPAEAVATAPQPATVATAPTAVPTPRRAAAPVAAPVATTTALAAANDQPAANAPKPNLVQRMLLKKVNKQLAKAESRQQNTASTEQTTARSGSLTILLVGLVALLLGIIIGAGWLTTIGAIIAVVGLILLLLKAL